MKHLLPPKPSNWLLAPAALYFLVLPFLFWWGCSGSQPQLAVNDPTNLCANALVMSSEVRDQATKVGLEPSELARQACAAAIVAVKLARANLDGSAGKASTDWLPLESAGAAGSP